MLIGFILLYLTGTLAIGWWASRNVKTASDFVVAGRHLPVYMVACALFATWFGSETVMGASSEFAEHGLLGIIEDPFGAALCLVLAGLLIARPLYNMNILTFNDFFEIRFGRRAEIISAFLMVPSFFSWITAQIVALAIVMQSVTGLEYHWGVLLCTTMVLAYTYIGGMWSVTVTDFFQTIAIIIGLTVLAVEMVGAVGGFGKMAEAAPAGFFQFFPDTEKPINIVHWFAAWMTIGLGSVPQQDVFQRVMSARSVRASIISCYIAGGMYLTIAALPLIISYCGKMLYPELAQGDTQMMIPRMVLQHSGLGVQILFFGALISAILSTCSGAMLAPATVIGENLIRPMRKDMSDKELLQVMRFSVVGVGIISGCMGLMRNNIYELVGESSAFSLVSLFVPLVSGLYWKKASALGATLSMLLGISVWAVANFTLPDLAAAGTLEGTAQFWVEFPPMLYGLAASACGMLAGSFIRPDRPAMTTA